MKCKSKKGTGEEPSTAEHYSSYIMIVSALRELNFQGDNITKMCQFLGTFEPTSFV